MKNLVRQAEADLERAAESPELANLRTELARTRRENQTLRSTNAALEDAQVCAVAFSIVVFETTWARK